MESASRMLFVFPLGEVVKLRLLHLFKDGFYTHCPVVSHRLLSVSAGLRDRMVCCT